MPLAANGTLFGALIIIAAIGLAVMVVYTIRKMRTEEFWDENQE